MTYDYKPELAIEKRRIPAFDTTRITNQVDAILSKLRCVEFAKRILTAVRLICSFQ